MMTERQMIEMLCMIDKQLVANKVCIDAYAGQEVPANSSIARLCKVTVELMNTKRRIQDRLLNTYGVFYM